MEVRRQTTLWDQTAVTNSSNLRDLLKLRERSERRASLTLGSILGCSDIEKPETAAEAEAAKRTLLDIIRDEDGSTNAYGSVTCSRTDAGAGGGSRNRISWKFFRGLLLFRRNAGAWIPSPQTISIPANLINPISFRSTADISSLDGVHPVRSRTRSPEAVRTDLAAVLDAERQQQQEREVRASPARVSLMALLEQTDVCAAASVDGGEGAEVIGKEAGEKGIGAENMCCVCMLRQKGAAFIPCGHTFCRLCSRELWISRGSCPLCNVSIHEILDIF